MLHQCSTAEICVKWLAAVPNKIFRLALCPDSIYRGHPRHAVSALCGGRVAPRQLHRLIIKTSALPENPGLARLLILLTASTVSYVRGYYYCKKKTVICQQEKAVLTNSKSVPRSLAESAVFMQ